MCDDRGESPKAGIQVVAGTYGRNCGGNPGNSTYDLAAPCDDLSACGYTITGLPDPIPGCLKDYRAEWTCGTEATVHSVYVPAEAAMQTVSLDCP